MQQLHCIIGLAKITHFFWHCFEIKLFPTQADLHQDKDCFYLIHSCRASENVYLSQLWRKLEDFFFLLILFFTFFIFFFFFFLFFETEWPSIRCLAQAGLELTAIHQPWLLQCCDYRHAWPHPTEDFLKCINISYASHNFNFKSSEANDC